MVDPADLVIYSCYRDYCLIFLSITCKGLVYLMKTFVFYLWVSLSENRSANVRDYCFFSLGAEFGLCLSFVLHFVHDVAGRFSLVESLILDNWNVNSVFFLFGKK